MFERSEFACFPLPAHAVWEPEGQEAAVAFFLVPSFWRSKKKTPAAGPPPAQRSSKQTTVFIPLPRLGDNAQKILTIPAKTGANCATYIKSAAATQN